MKSENISKAYATALYQLGKEKSIDVPGELTSITEVINKSSDLENLLFLDVFTPEEKKSVMGDIMNKLNTNPIVRHFVTFLIEEKREGQLPMIYKDVIVLDDHDKGFLRGTIEGSEANVDESVKQKIIGYLKQKVNKEINLEYVQSERITAGYKVTVEDLQLDASLDNQLEQLKHSVLNS